MTDVQTRSTFQGRDLKRRRPMEFGDDVETWQKTMKRRGWNIDVDSRYGPKSESTCKKFQLGKGLPETGVVDRRTWDMCMSAT